MFFLHYFQSETILIHCLRSQHLQLLQTIAVQFMKLDVINADRVYDLKYDQKDNLLPLSEILIGADTKNLLSQISENSKLKFLYNVSHNTKNKST